MSDLSMRQELELADLLNQPQLMFVLWSLGTHFCNSVQGLQTKLGADFPVNTSVETLKQHQLVTAKQGRLSLTPLGQSLANAYRAPTQRETRVGRVTSDKMQKTIVVSVESLKRHRVYKRTYKQTTKFKAHDEHNEARIGDTVRIEETRPVSKEKRWRLVEIIRRATQVPAVDDILPQ